MDDAQEITTLVGREVYTNSGLYVGEVEDVRLNFDAEGVTGLALREANRDLFSDQLGNHRGVMIPYRWVQSVGDVVLVSDVIERLKPDDEEGVVA